MTINTQRKIPMKKAITTFVVLGAFLLTSCQQIQTKVYVCTGGSAVCYHKTKKCIGLSNCSMEIKKIPKGDAEKYRRACKICY
jgi:hypothetical protein